MQLSPAAELALRGVRVLAEKASERPVPMDVICSEADLPKQYLVKIFSMLARADIVRPVRGKHGGYLLSRGADAISLLEVIEAVEGPLALNFCQHDPPQCEDERCPARAVWRELQETMKAKLAEVKLAAVCHLPCRLGESD